MKPAWRTAACLATLLLAACGPQEPIRIGFIGVGLRGQNHVEMALMRDDCEIAALADPDPRMMADTLKMIEEKGRKKPDVYANGPHDYQRLLADKNIDAVVIASPWEWHTAQCVAAMQAGKYVGTEVGGGFSLDECWQLVNTHEATGSQLMFMENVCYRRDVMAVLQMVFNLHTCRHADIGSSGIALQVRQDPGGGWRAPA